MKNIYTRRMKDRRMKDKIEKIRQSDMGLNVKDKFSNKWIHKWSN